MPESTCPAHPDTGKHRYSALISSGDGSNGWRGFLSCQDCPHNERITEEMERGWREHYDRCVAEGREYHGVMGDYWPPGVEHPPYA